MLTLIGLHLLAEHKNELPVVPAWIFSTVSSPQLVLFRTRMQVLFCYNIAMSLFLAGKPQTRKRLANCRRICGVLLSLTVLRYNSSGSLFLLASSTRHSIRGTFLRFDRGDCHPIVGRWVAKCLLRVVGLQRYRVRLIRWDGARPRRDWVRLFGLGCGYNRDRFHGWHLRCQTGNSILTPRRGRTGLMPLRPSRHHA